MTIEEVKALLNLEDDEKEFTPDEFSELRVKLDGYIATVSANDLILAIGNAVVHLTTIESLNLLIYMRTLESVLNKIFPDEAEEIMRLFDKEGGSEQ